ncbi:MAG: ABC transporter substrate-binding protein [Phycisphaerales bacterium]
MKHSRIKPVFRSAAWLLMVSAGFGAALWIMGWVSRPDLSASRVHYSQQEIDSAAAARDVRFDPAPAGLPTLHRDIKVTPTGESPILRAMVDAGELPPLKDRLPEEPVVLEGVDGIGRYGGTWLRLATALSDLDVIAYRLSGSFLARWSPLGYPVMPHIAKSIVPSEDKREWLVTLRKGMRWSDGELFTADDIMYWWECEANNTFVSSQPPEWIRQGGNFGRIEKIDEYRLRFVFPEPNGIFLENLTQSWMGITETPEHYLRPYHPDPAIGDQELIQREMQAYGLPSARALYFFIKGYRNPEHPRLWPWVYRKYRANPPQVYVRNPYYYVVDTQGNQLPYIDRLQFDVMDEKLMGIRAAGGGVSMQTRHIKYRDYTEFMSRREVSGTRILHWYPAVRSDFVIQPNHTRYIDPDDPSTKWKAKLLADVRFRRALSLAIDRQTIIRAEYNNIVEPTQVAPGPESPFHYQPLSDAYIQYDPAHANELLDELGLTQRDREGYRTFPDGTRMVFYFDFSPYTGEGPLQFIVDDWADVGIRLIPRAISRSLFYTRKDAANFDFNVWSSESDFMPLLSPRYFVAVNTECFYAVNWGRWFMRGGYYGDKTADTQGATPPPPGSPMNEAYRVYESAQHATTIDEQVRIFSRALQIAAEQLWAIGLAGAPPQVVVADKHMRNIPANALFGVIFATPANAGIETYFFDNAQPTPGMAREVRDSILNPVPRPRANAVTGTGSSDAGGAWTRLLLRAAFIGIGALVAVLIALRHPYIGRRLLIMVPTFLVISVVVFTIIQLPQGDFLTMRLIQLQESGDAQSQRQIEDLRVLFHFEDPAWKKYMRWMGFTWFYTFDASDAGLLQGDMGRSMETTERVNTLVGDRIMLTFFISLGTILMTWMIAIPIGIYSAVRQYSFTDYALTLLGFVGMSVPGFLLALVLMALSDVSGLFSPEFAAQPQWTVAKGLDLLGHIWIPIVVLGVGGTTGMIRVMRANLLDELNKPYVVTARAKGVRPVRLLLKYPVRMALNPFISGIGHLFPQLVSGGAIVAMVLALPTVGPLLLSALFSEDMYLAGSMLMVLSTLGVMGTLVSDLLLLWLDPRIRYEGGTR